MSNRKCMGLGASCGCLFLAVFFFFFLFVLDCSFFFFFIPPNIFLINPETDAFGSVDSIQF